MIFRWIILQFIDAAIRQLMSENARDYGNLLEYNRYKRALVTCKSEMMWMEMLEDYY